MDQKQLAILLAPLIRHGLTFVAGAVGVSGVANDNAALEISGILAGLIGLWLSNRNASRKIDLHAENASLKAEIEELRKASGEAPVASKE